MFKRSPSSRAEFQGAIQQLVQNLKGLAFGEYCESGLVAQQILIFHIGGGNDDRNFVGHLCNQKFKHPRRPCV